MSLRYLIAAAFLFILTFLGVNYYMNKTLSEEIAIEYPKYQIDEDGSLYEVISLDDSAINETIKNMLLNTFGAIKAGDVGVCGADESCVFKAGLIQGWICAASACDLSGQSARPIECFPEEKEKFSPVDVAKLNSLICAFVKFPNKNTRLGLLAAFPNEFDNDGLIQYGSQLLALNVSSEACIKHIKDYVGSYSSAWHANWYRLISGCKITSGESTVQDEENDYMAWLGVDWGAGEGCPKMNNKELHLACESTGQMIFDPNYSEEE